MKPIGLRRFCTCLFAIVLILSLMLPTLGSVAATNDDPSVLTFDAVPTTYHVQGLSPYPGQVTTLTEDGAQSAGVPKGYTGSVVKVEGSELRYGTTIDLRSLRIPTTLIESISFRLYFPASGTSFRMSNDGGASWLVSTTPQTGAWINYTLYADGRGFASNYNMKKLADHNGMLDRFGIGVKSEGAYFYIDSMTVRLKKDDGAAPELHYDGPTTIISSTGKPFAIDASAYDALEERSISLIYTWSEGALNSYGNLQMGEHTVVVSAKDYYGNTSSITLSVKVGEKDTEAPVIHFHATDIYVQTGTYARLNIPVTDNMDQLTVTQRWSQGAVDRGGRLAAGEHTLTLSATDLTGNRTTKTITVHVTDTPPTVGTLIQK